MESINVIDPSTGQAHAIPYDQLPHALKAGGQFADEEQKQKAIKLQDGTYGLAEPEEEEPKEATGLLGLGSDLIESLGHAFQSGKKFTADIPEMTQALGQQLNENPIKGQVRAAGQLGAGIADVGKSIVNSPHDLLKYLIKKNLAFDIPIPGTKMHTSDLLPHIPEDTGVEKALGLQPGKGDKLLRAIPEIAATATGAGALGKSVAKAVAAPSKKTLFKRALEDKIAAAEKEHSLSKGDLDSLKESLRREYSAIHKQKIGDLSPIGQEEAINVKTGKLEELKPTTEIPEQKVGEIPPEPDFKAIVEEKNAEAKKARAEAEETLGVLDNPKLKGGQIVQNAIKDVKKTSSDLYDSARKHYVDKKIMADNSKEIKAVTADLEELKSADGLAPGYGSGTAEQKALESQLSALKGEQVNASDIFDLQRTVEKMAKDTRKKQYSGVSDIEFNRLRDLAERLDSHAAKLATRLESVGGKEVQSMIKEANKGWKTYSDLKKNTVGRPALKKGELPNRAMIDIANTESGNEFLRSLTEAVPELKKHLLAAYVGETNVNKLLKPNSTVKEYLKALPEVEDKVIDLKEAIAGVKEGEIKASNIKKEYDSLVTSMKDASKQQEARQDAIMKSDKLKEQIKFHKDAIPKIEAKIRAEKQKGNDVSKLKDELAQHEKNVKDKGGRLKELGAFILKIKLINKAHL